MCFIITFEQAMKNTLTLLIVPLVTLTDRTYVDKLCPVGGGRKGMPVQWGVCMSVFGSVWLMLHNITGCARQGFKIVSAACAFGHKLLAFVTLKESSGKIPAQVLMSLRVPGKESFCQQSSANTDAS